MSAARKQTLKDLLGSGTGFAVSVIGADGPKENVPASPAAHLLRRRPAVPLPGKDLVRPQNTFSSEKSEEMV